MVMCEIYITVFTPTYNRKELLERLYLSLKMQKKFNFEWIIIDDGSTDGTENKVNEWIMQEDKSFIIRYYRQVHGGKHRAVNRAVQMANGRYFFIMDDDDYLTEDATEKIEKWGKEVEDSNKWGGISGLRMYPNGKIIGGMPVVNSEGYVDASNLERKKYHLLGDKAEAYKTEVLRQYPYPEFEGEYYATPATVWEKIASEGYIIRWHNHPIWVCEYREDGLTRTEANGIKNYMKNYKWFSYYTSQSMNIKKVWEWIGTFRRYNIVAHKLHKKWKVRAQDLGLSFKQYLIYRLFIYNVIAPFKCLDKIVKLPQQEKGW